MELKNFPYTTTNRLVKYSKLVAKEKKIMNDCEADKAVFRRLCQTQDYECVLYKDNIPIGIPHDARGMFFDDYQKSLKEKYPNIQIEVRDK
jgi:hypothetical protein